MHAADAPIADTHRPLRVVLTGGGTGGHLFPAVALGQAFLGQDRRNRLLFVGAGRPLEKTILDREGIPRRSIAVEGLKGRRRGSQIKAAIKIPGAVLHAGRMLAQARADLVVAVGGYAAGPVALAAWLRGIPVVVCEQNAIPGVANRLLFPLAKRIYLSFEGTKGRIDPQKKRTFGNPIREAFFQGQAREEDRHGPFTLVVVGGSQGARAINRAVLAALSSLRNPGKIRFFHQTGPSDQQRVQKAYNQRGLEAVVEAFCHDVASWYRRADLIVCRAGATTIAEVTAMGKPALFIPYPFAADNHQERNAKALVDQGAAEMIRERDLTGPALAARIDRMVGRPEALALMGRRSAAMGRPRAAQDIVEDCYRLVGPDSLR